MAVQVAFILGCILGFVCGVMGIVACACTDREDKEKKDV